MNMDAQTSRCMNLLTAVVMQCITDHQTNVRAGGVEKAMKQEPARWIMSDDDRPFGFVWCCQNLDLAPDRLRMVMNTLDLMRIVKERVKKQQDIIEKGIVSRSKEAKKLYVPQPKVKESKAEQKKINELYL
jgi:hypothetical protein